MISKVVNPPNGCYAQYYTRFNTLPPSLYTLGSSDQVSAWKTLESTGLDVDGRTVHNDVLIGENHYTLAMMFYCGDSVISKFN